ncbi:hypothetical protein CRE_00312 [Caenorhabditis remanei]|uniref:Uncharacterized protein n=2 Tax=Caenorhabditis remanei TaxID=31234 RepID=E3LEG5_CAERE|nr:hypothetical protein CRE_00312 [Caenorhabditis remanei]
MISLSEPMSIQWCFKTKPKHANLCEVCFRPFNLTNIDMHLESGCGTEIQRRYNISPDKETKKRKVTKTKFKISKKPKQIKNSQPPESPEDESSK